MSATNAADGGAQRFRAGGSFILYRVPERHAGRKRIDRDEKPYREWSSRWQHFSNA